MSEASSQPQPVVRVRGEVRLEVEPEIARFHVLVSAQDKDQQRTMARLSARNDAVRERIRGCGEAVEDLSTGALRVYPLLRDRRGEHVRSYQGQVRLQAVANDFAVLGSLLSDLAQQELIEIAGPWWELRTDSEVYVRARSDAAREAVERARIYAAALGAQITGVVELADVGLSADLDRGAPVYGAVGAARPAPGQAAAPPPQIELEPKPIEVAAQLEATFTMSAPSAL